MSANVDADPRDFVEGLPNIGIMLQDITEVDSSLFVTAFWSMLETIEMAFIGTVVGVASAASWSMTAVPDDLVILTDPLANNLGIQTESDSIFDFTDRDPFSEGNI